jgi:aminoglycoside phosphotransferase (APT) family kinase protein
MEEQIGALIGSGKEAEVFHYKGVAAKLYREGVDESVVRREEHNLTLAAGQGLPVPRLHGVKLFGGRWGIVMDLAPGGAFGPPMLSDPALTATYLNDMLRLHLSIHARQGAGLPDLKSRLRNRLERAEAIGPAKRARVVEVLDALPVGDRICHGDFHPYNIIGEPGAATVIDWLDATCGAPSADVCRTYVVIFPYKPEIADRYVEQYADASGIERADILRWLPVVAAARIVEKIPEEMDYLMSVVEDV